MRDLAGLKCRSRVKIEKKVTDGVVLSQLKAIHGDQCLVMELVILFLRTYRFFV